MYKGTENMLGKKEGKGREGESSVSVGRRGGTEIIKQSKKLLES